jgi:hypothetical protein
MELTAHQNKVETGKKPKPRGVKIPYTYLTEFLLLGLIDWGRRKGRAKERVIKWE